MEIEIKVVENQYQIRIKKLQQNQVPFVYTLFIKISKVKKIHSFKKNHLILHNSIQILNKRNDDQKIIKFSVLIFDKIRETGNYIM